MKPVIVILSFLVFLVGAASAENLPAKIGLDYLMAGDVINREKADAIQSYCQSNRDQNLAGACQKACKRAFDVGHRVSMATNLGTRCVNTYNAYRASVDAGETKSTSAQQANAPALIEAAASASSYSDPAAQFCADTPAHNNLWDCACVDQHANAARERRSQKSFEENKLMLFPKRYAYDRAKQKRAKETDPARAEKQDMQIAYLEEEIEQLETFPDLDSHSNDLVMKEILAMKVCRVGEKVAFFELTECQKTASFSDGIDDVDAYCDCVSTNIAEAWTSGEILNYGSILSRDVQMRIMQTCRG
ncbi:hypothetical protein [Hyphococcus sp. DH-69]|uniref:hypothetical protein n=1 Tax=Hyphococcus formosus TaxID=3143534 RepID=UPI00398BAE32